MSLFSKKILETIKEAMEGLGTLSGSQQAINEVQRYDKERRSTALLPCIQIRRLNEEHSNAGNQTIGVHDLDINLNAEVCLYVLRDPEDSATYDEVVEQDVGDLLMALYAIDWESVAEGISVNVSWTPLNVESEEDPEDGAIIRIAARYRSAHEAIQAVAPPWKP